MPGWEESGGGERAIVYCLVPRDLAPKLHEQLRRHFAGDPSVEVVVERRAGDRRGAEARRAASGAGSSRAVDRRAIRSVTGRRAGERRAPLVAVRAPLLPRRSRPYAGRLVFVERLEPSAQHAENIDTARLVLRLQAGDSEAFSLLYMRYFDRVYGYLRVLLHDPHGAEDAAQHVFMKAFEAIPRYEHRGQPFQAWLFTIVRNHALNELRRRRRLDLVDPSELANEGDDLEQRPEGFAALDWITDWELMLFIERLPLTQRQVLLLRYMLDLSFKEIAQVLDRSTEDVRSQHKRALGFLRVRLGALGGERRGERARMRRCVPEARVLRHRRFALDP
jgi:RNA polymerase sigma-70 factor (ECF subfamily)